MLNTKIYSINSTYGLIHCYIGFSANTLLIIDTNLCVEVNEWFIVRQLSIRINWIQIFVFQCLKMPALTHRCKIEINTRVNIQWINCTFQSQEDNVHLSVWFNKSSMYLILFISIVWFTIITKHINIFHINFMLFPASIHFFTINLRTDWVNLQMATIKYFDNTWHHIIPHTFALGILEFFGSFTWNYGTNNVYLQLGGSKCSIVWYVFLYQL